MIKTTGKELSQRLLKVKAVMVNNSKLCKVVRQRSKYGSKGVFLMAFVSTCKNNESYYLLENDVVTIDGKEATINIGSKHKSYKIIGLSPTNLS